MKERRPVPKRCWCCPEQTYNAGNVCFWCLAEGLHEIPSKFRNRWQMWIELESNPINRRRMSPLELKTYLAALEMRVLKGRARTAVKNDPNARSYDRSGTLNACQQLRIDLYETTCSTHGITAEELAVKLRADLAEVMKHLKDLLKGLGPAERALLRVEDGKYYGNSKGEGRSESQQIRETVMRQERRRKGKVAA